jgi:hypothetical protein
MHGDGLILGGTISRYARASENRVWRRIPEIVLGAPATIIYN